LLEFTMFMLLFIYFSLFYYSFHHSDLHSFPTRRSSDLGLMGIITERCLWASKIHYLNDVLAAPRDGSVLLNFWEPMAMLAPLIKDRKSTRLNSSHQIISYAVFCLKKKKKHKYMICLFID